MGMFGQTCGIGEVAHQMMSVASICRVSTKSYAYCRPPMHEHTISNNAECNQDINLLVANASYLSQLHRQFGSAFFDAKHNIAMPYWETSCPPEQDVRALSFVQEIWVSSAYLKGIYENHFDGVITHVPLPIERKALTTRPPDFMESRHATPYLLFCFDLLSSFTRKNPLATVRAFKAAFKAGEGPVLVVKTMNGNSRPEELTELLEHIDGRKDILLYDGELEPEEMNWLMANCTAYVSLHRSEGLGLTLSEALAMGRPLIATGYSGNMDFCHADNTLLCDYRLAPVPRSREYAPVGIWAEPDLEHATSLMQKVWRHRDHYLQKAEIEREKLLVKHSRQASATVVNERLQEILRMGAIDGPRVSAEEAFAGVPAKSTSKSNSGRKSRDRDKLFELASSIRGDAARLRERPSWFKGVIQQMVGVRSEKKRMAGSLDRVARSIESVAKRS